jgi:hypothetical protein
MCGAPAEGLDRSWHLPVKSLTIRRWYEDPRCRQAFVHMVINLKVHQRSMKRIAKQLLSYQEGPCAMKLIRPVKDSPSLV